MARYLHFACVPCGKKLLSKSAIKAAEKRVFAFQQPPHTSIAGCSSSAACM